MSVQSSPNTTQLSGLFNESQWLSVSNTNIDLKNIVEFPYAQGSLNFVGVVANIETVENVNVVGNINTNVIQYNNGSQQTTANITGNNPYIATFTSNASPSNISLQNPPSITFQWPASTNLQSWQGVQFQMVVRLQENCSNTATDGYSSIPFNYVFSSPNLTFFPANVVNCSIPNYLFLNNGISNATSQTTYAPAYDSTYAPRGRTSWTATSINTNNVANLLSYQTEFNNSEIGPQGTVNQATVIFAFQAPTDEFTVSSSATVNWSIYLRMTNMGQFYTNGGSIFTSNFTTASF